MLDILSAFARQMYRPRTSMKKTHAQAPLQPANTFSHRGSRKTEPRSRLSEAHRLAYVHKNMDAIEGVQIVLSSRKDALDALDRYYQPLSILLWYPESY